VCSSLFVFHRKAAKEKDEGGSLTPHPPRISVVQKPPMSEW
jgi:hypothetical protein